MNNYVQQSLNQHDNYGLKMDTGDISLVVIIQTERAKIKEVLPELSF